MSEPDQGTEMSFLDHLEALRWHLIRSAVAIVVAAITAFSFPEILFDELLLAPLREDFYTYRKLCEFSLWIHNLYPDTFAADVICIGQSFPNLITTKVTSQFMAHIISALVAGIVVAFPYVFWEIWRFVKPALHSGEKKYTRGTVFWVAIMFSLGGLFGYYVISPMSVNFLLNYSVTDLVDNMPTLNSYLSLVNTIVLACGVVFELPILVYFLTKIGLVTPQGMRKYRRHSLVAALILSAVITPPDIFSQVLVSLPLLVLYEISIWISRVVISREEKREAAE